MHYDLKVKALSVLSIVALVTGSTVEAFSSRTLLDEGKISKPNYFNKIQRSVVGSKGQVKGTIFDIETDGGFVDDLTANSQIGDTTTLPVEGGSGTGKTDGDIVVGGSKLNSYEVTALKENFVLKLKNKNGQIENFSILDKKFYEFVNFINQNVKNEDLDAFIEDVTIQLETLRKMDYEILASFDGKEESSEVKDIANQLNDNILVAYKGKLEDLSKTSSAFDSYISVFSANYGMAAGDGKILTRLNNPFSFSTVSYGSILTQIANQEAKRQSSSNVTIGMKNTQGTAKYKKSNQRRVGGGNVVIEPGWPPEGGDSQPDASDAEIIGRANSVCSSRKAVSNPSFPSSVPSTQVRLVGGRAKDLSVIKTIYKNNGNSFAGKKYDICVQIFNRCVAAYTVVPKSAIWWLPSDRMILQEGSLNGSTCTKVDNDGYRTGTCSWNKGIFQSCR